MLYGLQFQALNPKIGTIQMSFLHAVFMATCCMSPQLSEWKVTHYFSLGWCFVNSLHTVLGDLRRDHEMSNRSHKVDVRLMAPGFPTPKWLTLRFHTAFGLGRIGLGMQDWRSLTSDTEHVCSLLALGFSPSFLAANLCFLTISVYLCYFSLLIEDSPVPYVSCPCDSQIWETIQLLPPPPPIGCRQNWERPTDSAVSDLPWSF